MIKLLRPCGNEYPDGKQFGEWGPMWGYHFEDGKLAHGQVERDGKMMGEHLGRDIVCPIGTQLLCPSDVESVIRSGWQDDDDHGHGYGYSIVMQLSPLEEIGKHLFLILTLGHMSEIFVNRGTKLKRGDVIGKSGDTGNTSGPHVHVQLEMPGPWPRLPINFEWE